MSENTMKKQALLIGINQYAVLPELKFARQDAEAVADALEQNYCFSNNEVMLLTDTKPGLFKPLNKHIILTHLEKLANQDLDLFIFGFWGHGLFRNGERYLCPLDVMTEAVEDLGLPFGKLQEALSKIRAKNTCLILDCCQTVHDRGEVELMTDDEQEVLVNVARDIGLKRKKQTPTFVSNVALLNSCTKGQSAYEWDDKKHGIFTAHLLDAMNRRLDSVGKIVTYLEDHVTKTALELGKTQVPFCKQEGTILLPVNTKTETIVGGDVFISYRHANADLVVPIEKELQRQGISYFIDHVGVNYGMDYSEAISRALKDCKTLLFIWTKDADNSPDILREITMAFGLKKTVLPYKIGTFDVTEHNSLFYQLAPVSRYEVPKQTDATIKELVRRLQLALNGIQATKPVFVLPEQSKDAIIQKPEIGDIVVTVTPEQVEQKKIQFEQIQLPPLPEELIKIQSENKGLQTAIEQLQNFTHESLQQANAAVEQAQSQLDAWAERKERLWKDLKNELREELEKRVHNNPDCTEQSIDDLLPENITNQEYFDFIELFQCGKKFEQASLELVRVQKERQDKCNEIISKFKQNVEDNKEKAKAISVSFFDTALLAVLSAVPGYDNPQAMFPEDILLAPLRLLDKYELGWTARKMFTRSRELWKNKRPCVIEEHKQKTRELFEEAEKKRLPIIINSPIDNKAGTRLVKTINKVDFAFRWCPAGTFTMGSPAGFMGFGGELGRYGNEIQHDIILSKGFWIMEKQVTQKQWKAVAGINPSHFEGNDLPVENISWNDCLFFCQRCKQYGLSVSLPTEVQWEYACRAGTTMALNNDKNLSSTHNNCPNLNEVAWYYENSNKKTHPVGMKKPNAWGLYDMHGNVWERCDECFYPSNCVTDPERLADGCGRVIYGGSWNDNARSCRSACHFAYSPQEHSYNIGARFVINTID